MLVLRLSLTNTKRELQLALLYTIVDRQNRQKTHENLFREEEKTYDAVAHCASKTRHCHAIVVVYPEFPKRIPGWPPGWLDPVTIPI